MSDTGGVSGKRVFNVISVKHLMGHKTQTHEMEK